MEEEKKFIIREDQIREIELHLNNHSLIPVRAMLKQLPLFEEDKIKNTKEKNFSEREIEDVEIELCRKLDEDVYFPVKEELKGIKRTYSLGMKKEDFKITIHNCLIKLNKKQEVKNNGTNKT